MMMHDIFGEDLFDDFMDDFAFPAFPDTEKALYGKHAKNLMKTDVKETDTEYELIIDLPGFKKEDVKLDLENGYLTITANRSEDLNEKDKEGHYIRQERCTGSCARSFYVGEEIKPEDVTAKFENGILSLKLPKAEPAKLPEKKPTMIEIEG